MLAEWTISVLMDRKDYKVVERILLSKILEEQALGLGGALDPATIAKVGAISGTSELLFGNVGKIGQKYLVTIKIIDVSSAETILSQRGSARDIDSVPDLLVSLINQRAEPGTNSPARENTQNPETTQPYEEKHVKITPMEGVWDGFYQYDDSRRGYIRGNFTANFKQPSSQSVKGDITEPRTDFGPKNSDTLHSMMESGSYDSSTRQITFTKVYDYDGHKVEYTGTLVGEDVVTGRWNIGTYTGSWRAVRRN
jgi:hypothetical protein